MANLSKFVLNPELWRNLPSQYLEDSLLCSRPKDASNFLLVSKDINEVIEENRDRMPLVKNQGFSFFIKQFDDIEVNPDTPHRAYVDCRKKEFCEAGSFHGGFGSLMEAHCRQGRHFSLPDITPAELTSFFHNLARWVDVERVLVRWNTFDPDVLSPLIESGASIGFKDVDLYDDELMDVIESLAIRNIEFPMGAYHGTWSFYRRLELLPLDKLRVGWLEMMRWCDCAHVISTTRITDWSLLYHVVHPFYNGGLKLLKTASFRLDGIGDWSPLEAASYVPTAAERAPKWPAKTDTDIRVFLLSDKKRERVMEVKASLVSKPFTWHRDVHVELRITRIGSDAV